MTSVVFPAPLSPTIATICPASTQNDTSRSTYFAWPSSYANATFWNSTLARVGFSGRASGRSPTSVCVSSIVKMRSEAAIACCRLVFTRLSFLIGVYIMKAAKMNPRKLPCVVRPCEISPLPYQIRPTTASPPRSSISGGSMATVLVIFRLVR